jgi:hypothetical protein
LKRGLERGEIDDFRTGRNREHGSFNRARLLAHIQREGRIGGRARIFLDPEQTARGRRRDRLCTIRQGDR